MVGIIFRRRNLLSRRQNLHHFDVPTGVHRNVFLLVSLTTDESVVIATGGHSKNKYCQGSRHE